MPPIVMTNTALVTVEGRYDNQQIVNVFSFNKATAAPSNADIDALALWWGNVGWGYMIPILSTSYSLYQIRVKNVNVVNGYEHDVSPSGTQVGARGGDPLPGQNSLCVSWRTSSGGRSYRGRTYIGPLSELDVLTNYVISSYMNAVAIFASQMIAARPGGIWRLAVGSRKLHLSTPVTAAALDAVVDSTDRRKPGHGH